METDIFDNKILCRKCNSQMKKLEIFKNGFKLRVMVCPKCNEKIIHPVDELRYKKFISLKNKEFRVKMRLVGNSYAVSIPKEIISFVSQQKKIMNEMVNLCFEDMGKLSLNFRRLEND
jgi:NAD-dependent SIR2 family protein deacetylase